MQRKNDDQPKLFGDPEPEPKWQKRDDFPTHADRVHAEKRRDRGMERAEKHADRATDDKWRKEALEGLKRFLQGHKEPFLAEQFIAWGKKNDVIQPPGDRSWGGVFSRAARMGLIRKVGSRAAVTSNLGLKIEWQAVDQ